MQPKVSVVTVVFNDVLNIESTLKSVTTQSYEDIEYLVIDGGSDDGTKDVLETHRRIIDVLVSETDQGIYDAMNKGVKLASGEWVLFMNSGDQFYSNHVLSEVFAHNRSGQVLYGDHHVRFEGRRNDVLGRAGSPKSLIVGSQFSHQSSLVKRDLLTATPFRTDNRLSADHHFFLYCYESGVPFEYVPVTIASISAGGVSDTQQVRVIREWEESVKELAKTSYNFTTQMRFRFMIMRALLAGHLKKVLGRQ